MDLELKNNPTMLKDNPTMTDGPFRDSNENQRLEHILLLNQSESIKDESISNDLTDSASNHEDIAVPNSTNGNNIKAENSESQCKRWLKAHVMPKSLCPTLNRPITYLTYIVFLLLFWGVMYALIGEYAAPTSNLFVLFALVILSYLAGQLISLIRLPPLLGMLIMGIILRNVGYFNMTGVYVDIVSALRQMAMTVILIKAGLGLDAGALRRLSLVVIRLAFGPCIMEAISGAVVSHFLLGFSWLWGFLLGFVLAAVSPAVVVPSLLGLKEKGYGEDKGISTLVVAASSIDDIIAISGFGIVLGTIFSTGSLTQQILQGPLEILFGLSFGISWGIFSTYIPHRDDGMISAGRSFMVVGGGLFAVIGSTVIGYPGAGPLACIVSAFVACCGWKTLGWSSSHNPVADVISVIWLVFQPILFGLIGTEIVFSEIDGRTVGLGMAVLCIGLVIRVITVGIVTLGASLNLKERLFVAVAWFPKATVQAALGPVALDLALQNGSSPEVVELARQVLTIAVISILVTAPLGSVGIVFAGPRLLGQVDPNEKQIDGFNDLVSVVH